MRKTATHGLTDVYVECLPPASSPARPCDSIPAASVCLAVHRVEWLRTLESIDSKRLLCHFRAPDVESVRLVIRQMDFGIGAIWVWDEASAQSRPRSSRQ